MDNQKRHVISVTVLPDSTLRRLNVVWLFSDDTIEHIRLTNYDDKGLLLRLKDAGNPVVVIDVTGNDGAWIARRLVEQNYPRLARYVATTSGWQA